MEDPLPDHAETQSILRCPVTPYRRLRTDYAFFRALKRRRHFYYLFQTLLWTNQAKIRNYFIGSFRDSRHQRNVVSNRYKRTAFSDPRRKPMGITVVQFVGKDNFARSNVKGRRESCLKGAPDCIHEWSSQVAGAGSRAAGQVSTHSLLQGIAYDRRRLRIEELAMDAKSTGKPPTFSCKYGYTKPFFCSFRTVAWCSRLHRKYLGGKIQKEV